MCGWLQCSEGGGTGRRVDGLGGWGGESGDVECPRPCFGESVAAEGLNRSMASRRMRRLGDRCWCPTFSDLRLFGGSADRAHCCCCCCSAAPAGSTRVCPPAAARSGSERAGALATQSPDGTPCCVDPSLPHTGKPLSACAPVLPRWAMAACPMRREALCATPRAPRHPLCAPLCAPPCAPSAAPSHARTQTSTQLCRRPALPLPCCPAGRGPPHLPSAILPTCCPAGPGSPHQR